MKIISACLKNRQTIVPAEVTKLKPPGACASLWSKVRASLRRLPLSKKAPTLKAEERRESISLSTGGGGWHQIFHAILLGAAGLLVAANLASAQDMAITYQGRLIEGTNPPSGTYDLSFAIYDAASAGTQVGDTLTNAGIAVDHGLFTVALNFPASVYNGADRWLEIAVRTNGFLDYATLEPRQQITAAPYAVTARSVVSGGISPGTYGTVVAFTNVANQISGSFIGNGLNMTNLQATNVFGVREVVNARNYGAVADAGFTDSTLAISNAAVAARRRGLPLYIPGSPANTYYKVSGVVAVFDYLDWLRGVNVPIFDTTAGVEILMDKNTSIVQTADAPVFVFTNGINAVRIAGGKIKKQSPAASSTPGVAFYSRSADGQNSDLVVLDGCRINGFKFGLWSESSCSLKIASCDFSENQWAFWLVNTNGAGVTGTRNNSVEFDTCSWVNAWNGGYIRGGQGISFNNTESGGPHQTNFITVDAGSAAWVTLKGGNVELHHGAGVNVIGSSPEAVRITQDSWGLVDFSGQIFNIYSTNVINGPRVDISLNSSSGSVRSLDNAYRHLFYVGGGSTLVVGSNQYSGRFTNYLHNPGVMANLGLNYNGPTSLASEGIFSMRVGGDFKRRTILSYGAVSNWGVNQQVFNYPLLQYNYDKVDHAIPAASLSGLLPMETLPGITTNVSMSGLTLHITNGLIMQVSVP